MAECDPGANPFVARVFHDCLYNTRDMIGFCLGMSSIFCWLFAQLPQFILNAKNESVEALSAYFLACWLLGDTSNLLGCILAANQLPTQVYTAVYFIIIDMFMMTQYVYYRALERHRQKTEAAQLRRQQRHLHYHGLPQHEVRIRAPELVDAAAAEDGGATTSSTLGDPDGGAAQTRRQRSMQTAGRALACAGFMYLLPIDMVKHSSASAEPKGRRRALLGWLGLPRPPAWTKTAGIALGWTSSVFYLLSRVSQIYKNWSRGATEGLSLHMFGAIVTANLLYVAGILVRADALSDVTTAAPWLLGTVGTIFLDMTIFYQGLTYKKVDEESKPARVSLLVAVAAGSEAHRGLL